MNNSILASIREMLAIEENAEYFDKELIPYINSELATLNQLGVGPESGFSISGDSETWTDFFGDTPNEMVKTYVQLRVKMMFDPPDSSIACEAIERRINELEWRISISNQ